MRSFRSLSLVMIIVLFFLCMVSCDFFISSPETITKQYLDYSNHGNFEKAYTLLSSRDKAIKSLQQFSNEGENNPFVKTLADRITTVIKEVKVNNEKAVATVEITMPDLRSVMGDLFAASFSSALTGKVDDKALQKTIAEKMKEKNLPTIKNTVFYDLVKEKDGWRIYMGWENEAKITQLKTDAEKLEKQKKYAEAKNQYQEILKLSSRDEESSKKIKELEGEIIKYKEKQIYFPYIEVRGVHIGRGIFNEIGVFGEIKNRGNRTLKEVEITTYCLDNEGKVVFEKQYDPVRVSEFSFNIEAKQPLKPNYSRQFGCKLNDAPSDWGGEVKVAVTDVEFE